MLNNKYDNEKNNFKGESNFKVFGRKIEALPDEQKNTKFIFQSAAKCKLSRNTYLQT